MKVVFIKVHILFISIIFEAKTDVEVNLTIFYQYDNWLLDVILAFGPWVGLGLSRPYQT